jgi:hypothetical protein
MTPDLFEYQPPAQRHSETSKAAAEAIKSRVEIDRARILAEIKRLGLIGRTDCELQEQLGMNGSSQRPRRIELVDAGLVKDSGRTRKSASGRACVVWVAA